MRRRARKNGKAEAHKHRNMKRWRRNLVLVLLLLCGGAIINVTLAWACYSGSWMSSTNGFGRTYHHSRIEVGWPCRALYRHIGGRGLQWLPHEFKQNHRFTLPQPFSHWPIGILDRGF